jgi:hypothetical protein
MAKKLTTKAAETEKSNIRAKKYHLLNHGPLSGVVGRRFPPP